MQKGLEDAVSLTWRDADTARVAFLIADAPPHRKDAEQTLGASQHACARRASPFTRSSPAATSPAESEAAEVVLRGAALITGGQYLFLTDDSGVGDAHAEPHIPYYHVEKLNNLIVRMIAGELLGKRTDPDAANILRTVGAPPKRAGRIEVNKSPTVSPPFIVPSGCQTVGTSTEFIMKRMEPSTCIHSRRHNAGCGRRKMAFWS